MRTASVLVFFSVLALSESSFADWVMAPSTPRVTELASPELGKDYKRVLDYWHRQKYKKVVKLCDRLLKARPAHPDRVEDLYYLKAEALYQMEELSKSQKSFEKLVKEFPHTQHLHEVTKRQLTMARAFLGNFRTKLFGLPLYRTPGRGIKILESIFERDPYGSFADDAQVEMANYYFHKHNYLEAGERYKLVYVNYPRSELREPAAFRWTQSIFLEGQGPAYDSTYLTESRHAFEAFLAEFPGSKFASSARQALEKIVGLQAEVYFDAGRFYERQRKLEAARLYYRLTASRFPETERAKQASRKFKQLTTGTGYGKQ